MICPICGNEADTEMCKCSDEEIIERLILNYKKRVYEIGVEIERKRRKERIDKIKRFFGIKTSGSDETDAKK